MKFRSHFLSLTAVLAGAFAAVSCSSSSDSAADGPVVPPVEENTITVVSGTLPVAYEGNKVVTGYGDANVENGAFALPAGINSCVQTAFVVDPDDPTIIKLIARKPVTSADKSFTFDAESSALAMVTLYPAFAPAPKAEYAEILETVKSAKALPALIAEVQKVIDGGGNLYDENNTTLFEALGNVLEELTGDIEDEEEENYVGHLDPISNAPTRALKNGQYGIEYIASEINGNQLTMRNRGLSPTYCGTVEHTEGTENFMLLTRGDYGWFDAVTKAGRTWHGDPYTYTFTHDGEYKFTLTSKTNYNAVDYGTRLAGEVATVMGVELPYALAAEMGGTLVRNINNEIANRFGNNKNVEWEDLDWKAITEIISGSVSATFADPKFQQKLIEEGIMKEGTKCVMATIISQIFKVTGVVKGGANMIARIAWGFAAPSEIHFSICYYQGKASCCRGADLEIWGGNNQTGYANQWLITPLEVKVTFNDDVKEANSFEIYEVHYDVVSGGGKLNAQRVTCAKVSGATKNLWRLGSNGEQRVRARAYNTITKEYLDQEVFFVATIQKADVTVRLDWTRHTGATDIDLWVIDPYDDKIYYRHPYSYASGGMLDRDDRVGPGPEHIHWDQAPDGVYQIYVHYYPNGDEDKSPVTYKVSTTIDGKLLFPVGGYITYDEVVPVGQFEIKDGGPVIGEARAMTQEEAAKGLARIKGSIKAAGKK